MAVAHAVGGDNYQGFPVSSIELDVGPAAETVWVRARSLVPAA